MNYTELKEKVEKLYNGELGPIKEFQERFDTIQKEIKNSANKGTITQKEHYKLLCMFPI